MTKEDIYLVTLGCIIPFLSSFHLSQKVTGVVGITAIDRNTVSLTVIIGIRDVKFAFKGTGNLGEPHQ